MKLRSDAKLLNLPEEQQAQLADWLLSGMPYHVARATVEKEFGVRVALSAFTQFWNEVCAGAYIQRRARAVGLADEVAADCTKTPGQFDRATVDAIRQKAFELAVCPATEAKDIKAIFALLQKSTDQDLKRQQLALARDKFEWDAVKSAMENAEFIKSVKADKGLSEDAKLQAVRQRLFGQLPEENGVQGGALRGAGPCPAEGVGPSPTSV